MEIDVCLKKLLSDWALRREREGFATKFLENPHLPALILMHITKVEPFRAQAIADAQLHFALPMPFGFGQEIYFPAAVEVVPFREWQETIQNLSVWIEFCERMDGTNLCRYTIGIERIGREDDNWKIIEVFNEAQRAELQKLFRETKDFLAQKENN